MDTMSSDKDQATTSETARKRRIRFWAALPWLLSALLAVAVAWLAIELFRTRTDLKLAESYAADLRFLEGDAREHEREAGRRAVMYRRLLKEAKQLLKEPLRQALEDRERQAEAALELDRRRKAASKQ
jgi:hypothetical protein